MSPTSNKEIVRLRRLNAELLKENDYLNEQARQICEDYQDIGKELYYESVAHDATKAQLERLKATNLELLGALENMIYGRDPVDQDIDGAIAAINKAKAKGE